MLVYANGNVTRWHEKNETYLEIFQANQEGKYILCNQEKIEETNLVMTEPENVDSPYRYLEYDDCSALHSVESTTTRSEPIVFE
jgi:hypothetical protein